MIVREITFLPETFDKLKAYQRQQTASLTNSEIVAKAIALLTTETTEGSTPHDRQIRKKL